MEAERRTVVLMVLSDAVKTIEEVHNEGGKILSFKSFCGGLVSSSLPSSTTRKVTKADLESASRHRRTLVTPWDTSSLGKD